jgi:AcrR family transcriptional regulator
VTPGRRDGGVAAAASRASSAAVRPQLRRPGTVLGPRAAATIAKILDATRQIFLVRGYAGTTVDEITKVAGVSRGSFYTYFPSKRDVLLVLGGNSLRAAAQLIKALQDFPPDWTAADLEQWVAGFFELLDEHGSFSFAWTQAAHEDPEVRRAGMVGHLELCRNLGSALAALGSAPVDDPTELGLAVFSMIERAWAYAELYRGALPADSLVRALTRMIPGPGAAPRRPSDRTRPRGQPVP